MCVGSIVIKNDLLGFLIREDDTTCVIRDKDGREVTIKKDGVAEVANPNAIALLFYNKLVSGLGVR